MPNVFAAGQSLLRAARTLCAGLILAGTPALADPPTAARRDRAAALARIENWGVQYLNISPADLAATALDLVAVEPMVDGASGRFLEASEVALMRVRPDGGRRLVLAYLSVGEIDTTRFYWQPAAPRPDWAGIENTAWPGSLHVRFWHPHWQSILYGNKDAMLDQIMALGFDGVLLDRVDAFDDWRRERPTVERDMVHLIGGLASYARITQPGFLVAALNGERLLAHADYRQIIDAVVKESLLYGIKVAGEANTESDVAWSFNYLNLAHQDGRRIFAIEYLDDPAAIRAAKIRHRQLNFLPFFGNRVLDRLPVPR
jgi:cysteinyl-tRNA synthetase, unknown class